MPAARPAGLFDPGRRPGPIDPPDRPRPRPGPRLANDPDRHVRRVRNGRWQARPHDDDGRVNLGLFPTREQARAAVLAYWWGKATAVPKYTKPFHRPDGSTTFLAIVPLAGAWYKAGPFPTRAEAAVAARAICQALAGPLLAWSMLSPKPETGRRKTTPPPGGEPGGG